MKKKHIIILVVAAVAIYLLLRTRSHIIAIAGDSPVNVQGGSTSVNEVYDQVFNTYGDIIINQTAPDFIVPEAGDNYFENYFYVNPGVPNGASFGGGSGFTEITYNETIQHLHQDVQFNISPLNSLTNKFIPLFGFVGAVAVPQ